MNEYHQHYWKRDEWPHAARERWSFSLATLLRVITLAGIAAGYILVLPMARPDLLQLFVVIVDAVLGVIVAFRRAGTLSHRLRAGCGFLVNSFLFSIYTKYTARVIQISDEDRHYWTGLDELFSVFLIVAGIPITAVILAYMLRSWTWSAHDRMMHRRPTTHAR